MGFGFHYAQSYNLTKIDIRVLFRHFFRIFPTFFMINWMKGASVFQITNAQLFLDFLPILA